MMRQGSNKQPVAATRERILEAARLRFSKSSYEETGLRDIAADVGVDVAYVHRCFGSKEKLFSEAVRTALQSRRFLAGIDGDLSGAVARRAVTRDMSSKGEVASLDLIVRSLQSPTAGPVLRDYLKHDFIEPLAKLLERPSKQRAALVAAVLVGIGVLKNVLKLESLSEAQGGQLEILIGRVIEAIESADARMKPHRTA